MINKFMIIGEARSGTTSLNQALSKGLYDPKHKEVRPTLGEPFTALFKKFKDRDSERYVYNYVHGENGFFSRLPERTRDYINPIRSETFHINFRAETPQYVFDDVIDLSFKDNYGIKELTRGKIFCEKLLKASNRYDYKYIHLVRQNLLAMAISFSLSHQHQVWNIPPSLPQVKERKESWVNKIKNFPIEPLDIKDLEARVTLLTQRKKILEEKKNENWIPDRDWETRGDIPYLMLVR